MNTAMTEQPSTNTCRPPRAIRERCQQVFDAARRGELEHWRLDESKLPEVTTRVATLTKQNYPDLARIPYHGRYRHFDVGGVPRLAQFDAKIAHFSQDEQLAARFELVITSVLLDAGAGRLGATARRWRALHTLGGLGRRQLRTVPVWRLGRQPGGAARRCAGAHRLTARALGDAFQVSDDNPLTGVEGRAALLRRLGDVVALAPEYFGSSESARLGNLGVVAFAHRARGSTRGERDLGRGAARARPDFGGVGRTSRVRAWADVWRHSRLGFVPFHKLSQWLSYSLFEPLEAAGLGIEGQDALTGLAEYRNGGLYFDAGVLQLRYPGALERVHAVGSDLGDRVACAHLGPARPHGDPVCVTRWASAPSNCRWHACSKAGPGARAVRSRSSAARMAVRLF